MSSLLLSCLFIYSILIGINTLAVSGQCLGDQKALLLQLSSSLLEFDSYGSPARLGKWNQSLDCCLWEGISCEEGRVTRLNLSNEGLTGGIDYSSSLFNLHHLKSLDLSGNNFDTPIPSRISNLTNLSFLNLSDAGFEGEIPIEVSHLTSLVTLDFSLFFNPYETQRRPILEMPNLTKLIQNLSRLAELHLNGLDLSATGSGLWQALSSSVPNLRVLSMTNCNLSGPFDQSPVKLQSLSVVRLDNNYLSAPLPGFFANFSNLVTLSLTSCRLDGTFPKEIFQVRTLRIVDLSNNELLQGSLPEFQEKNALRRLVLSYTNFSGKLPTSIGILRNLSILDLAHCQFNGAIPNSMAKLTQLVHLDLSSNNLTGPIPSSLFTIPALKEIQLSDNQFSGQLLDFPNASYSSLRILDLGRNNLQGPIPVCIFNLKKLSVLSLSSNNLEGTIQLDMIQGLDQLTTLDLSYNNLFVNTSGNHSVLSSLPKISTLALASCQMKVFPYLKNLPWTDYFYLDLSDNKISGEIPNWIWQVGYGALYHLNLSRNLLVGMQEPYFMHGTLTILDLHLNQLQGKVPSLPTSASYIDLSSNNLTSSLPPEIGYNLPFTLFFSLSNNSLTGPIPESICRASYLQVLDLSTNNLSGKMPECISSAMSRSLGVLNLRKNNLSGSVSDSFPDNCNLRTLDLSRNLLEGHIPKSIANCSAIEVLNLGHNKLIDKFPCLLNLSSLQVLVLRFNKFYGPIECPNKNGTWAKLQILDLAHNNFSGEIPRKFLTKWKAMIEGPKSKFHQLLYELSVFSPLLHYQDTVSITSKGSERELLKILTIFTCIDLSSNNFQGPIPEELSQFQALYALNLSNNALRGQIPSSLQNLRQIESLDLSMNNLSGTIPNSLEQLTFLAFLNLSYNQLEGKIPNGRQFSTFSEDSFLGNGLCGLPLKKNCSEEPEDGTVWSKERDSKSGKEINWTLIGGEIGYIVVFGIVVGPIVFSKRWRDWYFDHLDRIAYQRIG